MSALSKLRMSIRNASYRVRRLRESIANLAYWLPILWSDRDWDHSYFLRLMRHKIARMRRHQELYAHADPKHVRKLTHRMRTCELLLERLEADDYYDYDSAPPMLPLLRPLTAKESATFKRLAKLEKARRGLDEELLFKLIRKHYRNWWD